MRPSARTAPGDSRAGNGPEGRSSLHRITLRPKAGWRRAWRALALPAAALLAFVTPPASARAAFLQAEEDSSAQQNTLIEADEVSYNDETNVVTATGHVEIQRGDRVLLADKIVYDRNEDVATATGHVSLLENNGSVFFFEKIEVSGDLKQGLGEEVRVLLGDKSRMASRAYRRRPNDVNELYQAVYTPCDSCDPHDPLWQLRARQVRYDRDAQMVYYNDAWLEVKGVPVFYTPYLAHPDPTAGPTSGFLLPDIGWNRNVGAFYKQPYYLAISPDKDATITPFLTTAGGEGGMAQYREDFQHGQVRLDGSFMLDDPELSREFRGNFVGWSRFDLNENWRTGTDINLATDQTYLRRYSFKAPLTWLTSNVFAERFTQDSYFSANAYYFQQQEANVVTSTIPIVAPLLGYNYLSQPDGIGGNWNVDASSLVLFRPDGTDTDRLSSRFGYTLPYTTRMGAIFTLHADVRADGYYAQQLIQPDGVTQYNGTSGRAFPEASIEARLPLVSDQWGFHQVLEPIVMMAVSPRGLNSAKIPNEDSQDVEFDDTNLFSLERFTGYDRVEEGPRLSYGMRWSVFHDNVGTVSAQFGQLYHFDVNNTFLPLSGLTGHLSDYVGHVDYTPGSLFNIDYRFRLDKDTLEPRRSEVTAGFGPDLARLGVSYIFIKADASTINTFGSTEEIYAFLSSKFSQHWSFVASHRQNLGANGGAISSDLGINYEDECVIVGINLSNTNTQDRDVRSGLAVLLRINLKTIGDIKANL